MSVKPTYENLLRRVQELEQQLESDEKKGQPPWASTTTRVQAERVWSEEAIRPPKMDLFAALSSR